MRAIIKQIPNLFTLANLTCGVLAIVLFLGEGGDHLKYVAGIILIFSATIFDFLDGFSAKLLKAQSPVGAQLDSLADNVTFGVAPGIMIYTIYESYFIRNYHVLFPVKPRRYYSFNETEPITMYDTFGELVYFIPFIALLIPIFSAYRLAKFNVDTEQTDHFKGIPTPANALLYCGMVLAIMHSYSRPNFFIISSLIIITSILMVSNLKMIAFKFKDLSFKGDNIYRYLLIAGAILLTIICSLLGNIFAAIPLTIIFYIFLSIPYHFYKTKNG